jgi:hypothetical protein
MTHVLAFLAIGIALALPLRLYAATPGAFRFLAEVTGTMAPGVPVRVPLPAEVLAASQKDMADLRLFDQQGQETPYMLSTQSAPPASTFAFRILSYSQSEAGEAIVLERPEDAGAFQEIEVVTTAQDFHKSVQVQTSADLTTWDTQAVDSIFDFSGRIALRKTTIEVARTEAPYLRLLLQDVTASTGQIPGMTLRYDGLEFSVQQGQPRTFRIDRIVGRRGAVQSLPPVYDQVSFASPDLHTDRRGNTVIALGRVNLPVTEVRLSVDSRYYYRAVELWTAHTDAPEAYRRVASGVVYNIPGMHTPRATLVTPPVPAPYMQLHIVNGDNPPLRVRHVSVAWPQYQLYFIPEAERRYTLYCGNPQSRAPVYEVRHVLPADPVILRQYPVVAVGQLQQNPTYRPSPTQTLWYRTDKTLFTGVLLLLTGGLGVWIYRLMRRLPARFQ